jgi:hypothetical protein
METKVFQLDKQYAELVNFIRDAYLNSGLNYGWKANTDTTYDFGHWNKQILENSKYFPYDHTELPYISAHPTIKIVWDLIKEQIGNKKLLKVYINGYTYGTDGYAHRDDEDLLKDNICYPGTTSIVYLNEKWNIDWAGETVLFNNDNDIELSVIPKFMRVLSFNGHQLHAARPVSRACGVLRSVLVFKTFEPTNDVDPIAFLLERTKNHGHSGKTFFEHLYNTMFILEKGKENKDLCAAGLFHSIYGTEFYKFNDPSITRDQVRHLIGDYAESLVFEFCILFDRFNVLVNNTKNYNKKFRRDLIKIEIANLMEQNASGQYSKQIEILRNIIFKETENDM